MPKYIHVPPQYASKLAQAVREALADIKKGALMGLGGLIIQKLASMGAPASTATSKNAVPQGHHYHEVDD